MIGKILGNRYELLEKVGAGGMAVVFKARCHLLHRFVAVKVLREEYVTDQEFLKKFSKEAQAAASLSHQNIVNVYDVGNEDGMPYIVMEYVEGKTLKAYIDEYNGFLTNDEIANFARQIALALEHAHSNQIIHRDIKPHNILVAKDGTLKVGDFGIASAISETTTSYSSEAIGSVKYTSPEQARGKNVDQRTDLYALGVLMYEMATRTVPFRGDTAVEIALKHMKEDIVPPSTINSTFHKGLESVVMRSLLKDISERYQSARELIDDLEKIINNPSVNVPFYDFDSEAPTQKIPSLKEFDILDEGENRKMKIKKPTQQKINLIASIGVVLLAFVMVLVIFVVSRLADQEKVNVPESITLDSVVGMTYEEGKIYLEEQGYTVIEGDLEKNNEVPAGSISSQRPVAGTKLRPGYKITLNISEGATLAKVPNLLFKTVNEAEIIIENSDFTIGNITYVNDDLDKGYILEQDPIANAEAKDNAAINLIVSLGPEYNKVIMPRLTDMTLEDAQRTLIELGLEVGNLEYVEHVSIEKDHVISQSVQEGTELDLASLVDLSISLGQGTEEEEENPDENADTISSKAYNIPTGDYKGQTITLKITFESGSGTVTLYEQSHTIAEDMEAVLVEVTSSGSGVLNFFVNNGLISSREVDFSN
ncbi:MAG: Stk1 family PASTA domain-containing Ser/Thr kinase [Clostridia bacterium]|nr:Stk1 family PASTA domain-containing Ser/Thr kinase [Clostridia bacterium]